MAAGAVAFGRGCVNEGPGHIEIGIIVALGAELFLVVSLQELLSGIMGCMATKTTLFGRGVYVRHFQPLLNIDMAGQTHISST